MKRIYTLFLLISFCANAQTETEPNNTFETANAIGMGSALSGTVNQSGDQYDYFRTILPKDGTLKVYVTATNAGQWHRLSIHVWL